MTANLDVTSLYLHNYRGASFPGESIPINCEQIRTQEFQNVLGIAVINDIDQIRDGELLILHLKDVLALIQNELDKHQN